MCPAEAASSGSLVELGEFHAREYDPQLRAVVVVRNTTWSGDLGRCEGPRRRFARASSPEMPRYSFLDTARVNLFGQLPSVWITPSGPDAVAIPAPPSIQGQVHRPMVWRLAQVMRQAVLTKAYRLENEAPDALVWPLWNVHIGSECPMPVIQSFPISMGPEGVPVHILAQFGQASSAVIESQLILGGDARPNFLQMIPVHLHPALRFVALLAPHLDLELFQLYTARHARPSTPAAPVGPGVGRAFRHARRPGARYPHLHSSVIRLQVVAHHQVEHMIADVGHGSLAWRMGSVGTGVLVGHKVIAGSEKHCIEEAKILVQLSVMTERVGSLRLGIKSTGPPLIGIVVELGRHARRVHEVGHETVDHDVPRRDASVAVATEGEIREVDRVVAGFGFTLAAVAAVLHVVRAVFSKLGKDGNGR